MPAARKRWMPAPGKPPGDGDRRPQRAPTGHPSRVGQQGAAAAWFMLLLPVLLLALGWAVDGARLVLVRAEAQAAADFASLAAVQELDTEQFMQGRPWLVAGAAEATARRWLDDALRQAFGESVAAAARVEVAVINAGPGDPRRHPWTGRRLEDPTVAVRAVIPVKLFWIPGRPPVAVTVAADASVARAP